MKATFEVLEKLLSAYCIESFGNSEEEIAEKEAESGIKFPKSLRDYYKKFGKCNYITKSCNNQYEPLLLYEFFIPGEDFFTSDKDYLVFYQCVESMIYCGIKFTVLRLEDPPVYICVWDKPGWYLENISLINFLVCKALIQIAVEARLPYWVYFRENMWKLSDYRKAWQICDSYNEIEESTTTPAWKIFIKDDVLIVFESVQNENEEYITGVSLASFDKENIKKCCSEKHRQVNCLNIKQICHLVRYRNTGTVWNRVFICAWDNHLSSFCCLSFI